MRKNISKTKKISNDEYKRILEIMPFCCLDIVLKINNQIMLFKRAYEPAKGEWWIIGGRILKNETFKEAIKRKTKEEAGIEVRVIRKIGVYETKFNKSRQNIKGGIHSVNVCFLAEPTKKEYGVKLNEEFLSYKLVDKIEANLHPYIKQVLKDSGVLK